LAITRKKKNLFPLPSSPFMHSCTCSYSMGTGVTSSQLDRGEIRVVYNITLTTIMVNQIWKEMRNIVIIFQKLSTISYLYVYSLNLVFMIIRMIIMNFSS
jgi:hypothetical protein